MRGRELPVSVVGSPVATAPVVAAAEDGGMGVAAGAVAGAPAKPGVGGRLSVDASPGEATVLEGVASGPVPGAVPDAVPLGVGPVPAAPVVQAAVDVPVLCPAEAPVAGAPAARSHAHERQNFTHELEEETGHQ